MPEIRNQLWSERLAALKNLPAVGRLIWESSRTLVVGGLLLRVVAALTPLAMLAVSKRIVDMVVESNRHSHQGGASILPWVVAEFGLASVALVLSRTIDYLDSRLADQFTHNISLRVMKQSARLDLASFEDPSFYDKLERARVQATDRVVVLASIGTLIQRSITLFSLAAGVIWYSPWLFLLLFVSVVPAFVGESHFAFSGYSLAQNLTPTRRELDYLRFLGSSRESAKEIKTFALGEHLHDRYKTLSEDMIGRNQQLTRRRLGWGALLVIIGQAGYYSGYVRLIFDAVAGRISVGTLTFLAGAIAGAKNEMQTLFSLFSSVSEHSLFLADLIEFLSERPLIQSAATAIPPPRPMLHGIEFREVSFAYPGSERRILNNLNLNIKHGERVALVGENGEGKTTLVKLLARLYDPTEGAILLDGVDLREYQVEELRQEIGILFPGFCPL